MSNNFKRDVPTVDLAAMIEASLSVLRVANGQNSDASFMKMAAGTTTLFE
jgi:hypothetical protein